LEAEGICRGEILAEPRGVNGFGYDPIFWVAEYGLSFAEMEPQLKAKTSHRGQAFAALLPQLEQKMLNLDAPRSEEKGILRNIKL
jgi:XTP/dITP diphosphohydrolase